jgi:hypothetical protein
MAWEDQGRQEHGWFGHGAMAQQSGGRESNDAVPASHGQRILGAAYGAIASLPPAQQRQAEAHYHAGTLGRLTEAMTAWARGARLDQADFAERFFGRAADDPVVQNLRGAAIGTSSATTHAEIKEAAGKLAEAMQAIGLYQWPRFVADAQARARDPATVAAIENSRRLPDVSKDAIRPVYPVETLLGIGAAGVAGGTAAVVRAVGRAILKQALPEKPAPTGNTAAGRKIKPEATKPSPIAEKPAISRQQQDGHIRGTPQNRNRLKQGTPTSTFDGKPVEADALTQEAWDKGTPIPKRPGIREYDFGRRIGEGPNGGSQSTVRVHEDSAGNIHGHPSGREIP